jgi:hypothetical protein
MANCAWATPVLRTICCTTFTPLGYLGQGTLFEISELILIGGIPGDEHVHCGVGESDVVQLRCSLSVLFHLR